MAFGHDKNAWGRVNGPIWRRELRSRAKREGKSLNEVAIDALRAATGSSDKVKYRDLSDLVGSWVHDEETEKALADQRRIDPEMWR